jgi:UDP-N-acetylmuramoyl-tripeptide--D-alanyl-D-alanine ligase
VAITGSSGKTTTKEWLSSVLSTFGATTSSKASFNNHWGVPLSLTALSPQDAFGVFEVGMNNGGEIEPLTKLIQPHIAVITTIGEAHIGHMGSLDAIAEEKANLKRSSLR